MIQIFVLQANVCTFVHTVAYISIKLYSYIFELEKYFFWRNISKEIKWNIFEPQLFTKFTMFLGLPGNWFEFFDQMTWVLLFGGNFFHCLAANSIRIICRTLGCENIPWNIPKYLNFNPHKKIKIFLQKYRNIEI